MKGCLTWCFVVAAQLIPLYAKICVPVQLYNLYSARALPAHLDQSMTVVHIQVSYAMNVSHVMCVHVQMTI